MSFNVFAQDIKYSDLIDINIKKNVLKVYYSYLSKDGLYFKAGDTIQVGFPSSDQSFAFISYKSSGEEPIKKSESGIKIIVVDFLISGSKKTGYQAIAVCKTGFFMSKYYIRMENAIEKNEIKTSLLSSDEALTKLKKAKEKLDLGVMTQEEFDKLKLELMKYIK